MDLCLDVLLMLACTWIVWSGSIGTNSAACIVLGDVLSTALTRDFDGSCAPTTFGEKPVLYYTGGCLESKSDD